MPEPEGTALCDDCKKLVGGDRRTPGHKNLKYTDFQQSSSIMGSADEHYYVCTICGQLWLHETGSCGYGWTTIRH